MKNDLHVLTIEGSDMLLVVRGEDACHGFGNWQAALAVRHDEVDKLVSMLVDARYGPRDPGHRTTSS